MHKLKSTVSILALASLSSLAIAPQAKALDSLGSFTDSFTNQITELADAPVLTLSQYSGSGTLEQVVFTVNATLASSGNVTNTASGSQTFNVATQAFLYDLTPGAGGPASLTTFSPLPGGATIGSQLYSGLASGATSAFGLFSINGSTGATFTDPTAVLQFVGSGTFDFLPSTLIATNIAGGGGNVATNISTLASADITVEYFGTAGQEQPPGVPFGFSTNASLVVFGGVFYGMNRLRKKMAAKKLEV
jgi:hypothetical protein